MFNKEALGTYDFNNDAYIVVVDTNNNKYYYRLEKAKIEKNQFSINVEIKYIKNGNNNKIIIKL